MKRALVIVESPAKARTIEKFLGRGYRVTASLGHVRDLPKSELGVDVEGGFTPHYITIRGKGEVVRQLRSDARKAERVFLATDPDREGEAISWHLAHLLSIPPGESCRVAFNEITRDAVRRAFQSPRPIDQRLVDAQQARRVLDRLVGYKLSPLLWRKVRRGLSAGRVQSVAVRLVCDREEEIDAFQAREYWTIDVLLRAEAEGRPFRARYRGTAEGRVEPASEAEALSVAEELEGATFSVAQVRRRERRRQPPPPFITSTLQQEAARKLGFSVTRTMRVAQELYEGVEVRGEGSLGLVTYIRTDSTRVSDQALEEARRYVTARFGADFAEPRRRGRKAATHAQEAHEAIRPTYVARTPEDLRPSLSRDQYLLYRLIWERFLASQMAACVLDTVTAEIEAGRHRLRATGSTVKFPGFTVLYEEGRDEDEAAGPGNGGARADGEAGGGDGRAERGAAGGRPAEDEGEGEEGEPLPPLAPGQELTLVGINPEQHFTQPPPRYSEAMLVRELEQRGIGRPSTYAPIISTIQERGYVVKEEGRFRPTELGKAVNALLRQHFPDVVDVEFTAAMEDRLDAVEEGREDWRAVVGGFYDGFARTLERVEAEVERVRVPDEAADRDCPSCGRPMVIKVGRYGRFLSCSGFPECRQTLPFQQRVEARCPRCGAQLAAKRSRRGRVFYGCTAYPVCDFTVWSRPAGNCPRCGHVLVEKGGRRERRLVCAAEECGYRAEVGEAAPALSPRR